MQRMLARYQSGVLSQTEPAAAAAGLAPERFTQLPRAYIRMVATRDAPAGTFADDIGGTGGPSPARTLRTSAANRLTGAASTYDPSLGTAVTADALDKIVTPLIEAFLAAGEPRRDPV